MNDTVASPSNPLSNLWNTPKGKGVIISIVFLVLLFGSFFAYWVYGMAKENDSNLSRNSDTSSLPPHVISQRDQLSTKKVEKALNEEYNSIDDLISAFTEFENSKESNLNIFKGNRKIARQALEDMSRGTISKLKTIFDGNEDVTMSQTDHDLLKKFIDNLNLGKVFKQKLDEEWRKNVKIARKITLEEVNTIKKSLGESFLTAINTKGFKVDISDYGKIEELVKVDDISALYPGKETAEIAIATELHGMAKDIIRVIKHCKDHPANKLEYNQDMVDKIERVKKYLTDKDYASFTKAFKPKPTGTSSSSGVEALKNFKPTDGCLDYNESLVANLKIVCDDLTAKANNPHLVTLCALQHELQTLHTLIEGKMTHTEEFEQLEHLLKLKQSSSLICPKIVDELLEESKIKVVSDYLNVAKAEDILNPTIIDTVKLKEEGKKLFLLLSHLQSTPEHTIEKRIIDLRDNDQLDTVDKLIIKDLSNLIQDLNSKSKDPTKVAEMAKLDAQITVLFKAIGAIDANVKGMTKAQYLNSLDAIWNFEEAKKTVIAELKTKIIDLNWKFATGMDPFKDLIEGLIISFDEAQKADPAYNCPEIKKPWKDTFKVLVKSKVIPELRDRLKADPLPIPVEAGKWAILIQEIKKIDPNPATDLFDEVKSLTKVTDGASLLSWITLLKSNEYKVIIERDFTTQPFDLSANADLIGILKTISGNPLMTEILKLDAIGDPSWTVLSGLISVIRKIEDASNAIRTSIGSSTWSLAQLKDVLAIVGQTGVVSPTLRPVKDNIDPLITDFIHEILAFHANNADLDSMKRCKQVADYLIWFKKFEDIQDLGSLTDLNPTNPVTKRKVVERLMSRNYANGLGFIQDFIEHTMVQNNNQAFCQPWYQTLSTFKGGLDPFNWDKLDITKYAAEKVRLLKPILSALFSINPSRVTVDLFTAPIDTTNELIKNRNNLFYSFDPIEPSFEINESRDNIEAKILTRRHPRVISAFINKKSDCSTENYDGDKTETKNTIQFMRNYLSLSQKFKDSLPSDITNITDGSTLMAFFEVRLPEVEEEFNDCISAVAMGQLRTAIINDPLAPTDEGIPALNECIKQRLQYGYQGNSIFERIARDQTEKQTLLKAVAERLVDMEIKSFSLSLVGLLMDAASDKKPVLKSGYDDVKKIETFAGTNNVVNLADFYFKCYETVLPMIGNQALINTTQVGITDSIEKVKNFKNLPELEEINSQFLLRAEMMLEILNKFISAAKDDQISAIDRSKETISQALDGVVTSDHDRKVKMFWTYKLAIWYLANRNYGHLVDIIDVAKKAINSSVIAPIQIEVMNMRDPSNFKWVISDLDKKIDLRGNPISNANLFDFLNVLVSDHLNNNGSSPFFNLPLQAFINELITNNTIDMFKNAILFTDYQWEITSLANDGRITKSLLDDYIGGNDFRILAVDCAEKGHVNVLLNFVNRQKLFVDPPMKRNYHLHITQLTSVKFECEAKKKLVKIDSSLISDWRFDSLFNAFINPRVSSPNISYVLQEHVYKNAPADKDEFKREFWSLYKKFMNASIKYYIFATDNLTDLSIFLYQHQVLIYLRRFELFNATIPTGRGISKFHLSHGPKDCNDRKDYPTQSSAVEDRYINFLQLVYDVMEDPQLSDYHSVFDNSTPGSPTRNAGAFFFRNPSIYAFWNIVDAADLNANEYITGLKTYVAKRRIIVDDPIQNAINEVLGTLIAHGEAGTKRMDDPIINVALHQLEAAIDDNAETLLNVKLATAPSNIPSRLLAYAGFGRIFYKLKMPMEPINPAATSIERIRYCYLFLVSENARNSIEYANKNRLDNFFPNSVKTGGPFYHEGERSALDEYVQYHRLYVLFSTLLHSNGRIEKVMNPLDRNVVVGFKFVDMESCYENTVDEMMKMPLLLADQRIKVDLISAIKDGDSHFNQILSIQKVINEKMHSNTHYLPLLMEEDTKMIWDEWNKLQ